MRRYASRVGPPRRAAPRRPAAPRRFPTAGSAVRVLRPSYCAPHGHHAASAAAPPAFEAPQDVVTLLLAHKLLGIGAWRRFVAGMQTLAIRSFADKRFDKADAEAGARQAYEAVTALAFGGPGQRDHTQLRELVSETVAESMIVACRKAGEGFTTLHTVMASEIIGVRMMAPGSTPTRRGPPTRLCFDVRFLSCESIRPTDTAPDGPISLAASTWRFEGDVARVPAGEDAATFTGELEQLEPEWEVRPFSSPAPRAISASSERGGCAGRLRNGSGRRPSPCRSCRELVMPQVCTRKGVAESDRVEIPTRRARINIFFNNRQPLHSKPQHAISPVAGSWRPG